MAQVWNVGNRIVNTYVVRTDKRTILVDTGYPEQFAAFCARLAALGLTLAQIDTVLLTHGHDDHAGFLTQVLAATDAQVVLHPAALLPLQRGQNRFAGGCVGRLAYGMCLLMKLAGKGEHRFPPLPQAMEPRLQFITPETRPALEAMLGARLLDTPGHTACSISMLTAQGQLFCGDAAMNGFPSHGHVTIWAEDLHAYRDTWAMFGTLGDCTLYPGHGKPFAVGELARTMERIQTRTLYRLQPKKTKEMGI